MTSLPHASLPPNIPPAHAAFFEGVQLQQAGRDGEAKRAFQRALALEPGLGEAAYNLGVILEKELHLDAALEAYELAALGRPGLAEAQFGRGNVLLKRNRLPEARLALAKALELKPAFFEALQNLGNVLRLLNDLEGAESCLLGALKLRPQAAEIYAILGNVYRAANQLEKAEAACLRALELEPELAEAHVNLSIVLLIQGRFAEGWLHAEYRVKLAGTAQLPRVEGRLWTGAETLAGKTLLVHGEQGLGDTLQYVRYAKHLRERGARVLVAVQAPLERLLRLSLSDTAEVLTLGQPLPAFDFQCPLPSLPLACGTTLETIPQTVPYLQAPEDEARHWRAEFASERPGPALRVGFSWAGNPSHSNDTNRSIALEAFVRLFSGFENIRFYALKNEISSADRELLRACGNVTAPSERLSDFAATAALVRELDLVIAVDTSVAHLAGALAKPSWVLLPFSPDWRWLLERNDSPWYPTARLFRQKTAGNWTSVLDEVREALARRAAERP